MSTHIEPTFLPLFFEYYRGMEREIHGPLNRWYAGEALGQSPTPEQARAHYETHGGPQEYRKNFAQTHPGALR